MVENSGSREPIKASTLSTYEWNPVDAYIEHLKEIGDTRVSSTPKDSEALQEGEALHEDSFGLMVALKEEDTNNLLLEKMRHGSVAAVNHGEYQIQGAPDTVVVDDGSVRVEDMKTTGWDNRDFWEEHQLPSAAFQVRIYSWMLSHVPDVEVENPRIAVKQREGGEAVDWFTHEVEYETEETEEDIEHVLSMLEKPKELAPLRPDEDWKNDYWDEFLNLAVAEADQQTLGDY